MQTKTKELYPDEPQTTPGDTVPSAYFEGLRELGATEFYPRAWEYRHAEHTLKDLMRPGYFSDEARARLRVGDEIHYFMQGGKQLPSEWERGICVVEVNPNSKELPLILAGYIQYGSPTPWRK
jgi:hypothetical protein